MNQENKNTETGTQAVSETGFEKKYRELFPSEKEKAEAFDRIAEKFYFANFGSTGKAEIETLMFSLYLDRILENTPDKTEFSAYSDYTLSKLLGISQSRVSSLKVRKELLYPYHGFDWRDSFAKIVSRASYHDRNFILYIPDKNLYLEIKNAIEEQGGYTETQLTPNLLKVRDSYFLDLVLMVEPEKNRKELRKELQKQIKKQNGEILFREEMPLGAALRGLPEQVLIGLFENCIPVAGPAVKVVLESIIGVYNKYKGVE